MEGKEGGVSQIKHFVIKKLPTGKFMIEKVSGGCEDESPVRLRQRLGDGRAPSAHQRVHLEGESEEGKKRRRVQHNEVILRTPITRQGWEYNHDDVELTKKLGEGAFGEVHKGRLRLKDGKKVDVAVKLVGPPPREDFFCRRSSSR